MLDLVSEIKLVGVIVSDDLRWQKNTDYICQKATQKLWTLRRLRKFNLDINKQLDVYVKEVRSLLEYAVPVWHSGLTKRQSGQIEKIQKTAFQIILGDDFTNYEVACTLLGVEPLEFRRIQLCINFSKKDIKKDNTIFSRATTYANTRRTSNVVKETLCRTHRYEKSSLPFLSKLLNKQT